jgi:MarR family transcriptional regulator for hemolysin
MAEALVSLTEAARAKLPAVRRALSAGSEHVLAGFTQEEIATLVKLTQRLTENLDRAIIG